MTRAVRWLDLHFEEAILVFLLVVIACVELLQVVCRNIPGIPSLTWAEELCRFAWIATVFLSLPFTIRTSNMLRVSVLLDALPDKAHNFLNILVDALTCAMMAVLAVNAVAVMTSIYESGETSPAMLFPMWIMYLIVVVGFILGFLRSIQMAIIHIIHFNERPITQLEAQIEREAAEDWLRPAIEGEDAVGAVNVASADDAANAVGAANSASTSSAAGAGGATNTADSSAPSPRSSKGGER